MQSNQFHFIHILKTIITHLKQSQVWHTQQIQSNPFYSITAPITHDQFFNTAVKEFCLIIQHDSLLQLSIIQPLPIIHHNSISIILNASSPSLAFTNLSFILYHSNVSIVASSITHTHIANPKSFIRLLSFLVIQHAPAIGFVMKHIAFPSLSFITQVQHGIMFNSTHILSIHAQQLM